MGTAVSRDHAKLPFGYTHARKDHPCNPASLSRRRLASRLLRTSDTTSVRPFPSSSSTNHDTHDTHSSSLQSLVLPPSSTSSSSLLQPHPQPHLQSHSHSFSSPPPPFAPSQHVPVPVPVPELAPETPRAATNHSHSIQYSSQGQQGQLHAQEQECAFYSRDHRRNHSGSCQSSPPAPKPSVAPVKDTLTTNKAGTQAQQQQQQQQDLISSLDIAHAHPPHVGTYDFFSPSSSSSSSSSSAQPSRPIEDQDQGQSEDDDSHTMVHYPPSFHNHHNYHNPHPHRLSQNRKALSYELPFNPDLVLKGMELEEEAALAMVLARAREETTSVLDEEIDHLSPIPFSELPSLTNIGLCSHGIVRLSSNIRLLASATCVQICCNELSRLPPEIGQLRNLTLLDLCKNRLTALPNSIFHLSKLVDLKLSFNRLESLPSTIGGLTKLATLALDNNCLQSIPFQVGHIKGLVNLDLSFNPIKVLPAEVGKLQFLRRLRLERCPLILEFHHSPLHSPPTLRELAARVMVRQGMTPPPLLLRHLKDYLKSARVCDFCDGPFFDSWVKRGKLIEKNDMYIPLEYTLCQPHWNTELERVKLLFCKKPITAPVPKTAATVAVVATTQSSGTESKRHSKSASTFGALSTFNSTLDGLTFADPVSSSSSSSTTVTLTSQTPTARPSRTRKGTMEGGERERPLSLIGNRLSMLLRPKEKQGQRARATSMSAANTLSSAAIASSPSSSTYATPTFSVSMAPPPPRPPSGLFTFEEGHDLSELDPPPQVANPRLMRPHFMNRRPLSLGSALDSTPQARN